MKREFKQFKFLIERESIVFKYTTCGTVIFYRVRINRNSNQISLPVKFVHLNIKFIMFKCLNFKGKLMEWLGIYTPCMRETPGGLSSLLKKKISEINKCCFIQIPNEKIKVF